VDPKVVIMLVVVRVAMELHNQIGIQHIHILVEVVEDIQVGKEVDLQHQMVVED
jgi:hypothetical protein